MDKVKEILAKYWVAILCGIVALAAIITSFIPLGSYHQDLHAKLQTSAANFSKADALIHKSRNKPLLPGQSTPDPLPVFPSKSIIETGEALSKQLDVESQKSVKTVVDINRHQPLLPILPNPNGVDGINYRSAYVQRLVQGQNGKKGTLFTDALKAGLPPTPADVKTESDRIWKTKYESQLVPDPNNPGKAFNEDSVKVQFAQEDAALPIVMRQQTATSYKLYAGQDAITVDPVVSAIGTLPPDPKKIWWSQMQLWVIEDVAKAISEANEKAADVTQSPIKRLLKLEILGGQDQGILFTGSKNGAAAPPMMAPIGGPGGPADPSAAAPAIVADPNTPLVANHVASPSGRVSNPMFDVVQFRLDLVVAAKDIPWIVDCLCRNRLMSVLNIESIIAEDTAAADRDGYFYGTDPVVRISIRCESLFMREWTLPLMPEVVKRSLASLTAPQPGM